MNGRRWTYDLVEQSFRDFAIMHGHPPTWEDLGRHGLPWPRTVERLYGTFGAAMKEAGFTPRGPGRPRQHRGGVSVAR